MCVLAFLLSAQEHLHLGGMRKGSRSNLSPPHL